MPQIIAQLSPPVDVSVLALGTTFNHQTGMKNGKKVFTRLGNPVFVYRTGLAHGGTDITVPRSCKEGTLEPVLAMATGRVVTNRFAGNAGHHIEINHLNGWASRYLHLHSEGFPYEGDMVTQGQAIGWVGDTGHSSGCHVHVDLYKNVPAGVNNIFGYSGKQRIEVMSHLGYLQAPSFGGPLGLSNVLWLGAGVLGAGAIILAIRKGLDR